MLFWATGTRGRGSILLHHPAITCYQMATEQTNLRLDTAIKAQAIAAAGAQGIPLARLVERALVAYLSSDSGVVAPGSSPDSAVLSDLIARVERLERGGSRADSKLDSGVVAPKAKQPRQDAREGASKAAQASQHPPESGGLSVGAALVAAGAELPEAYAMGSNRDERMRARYGMKAREWLQEQGWRVEGRKWYPPAGSG
jgi:hypothetical protein